MKELQKVQDRIDKLTKCIEDDKDEYGEFLLYSEKKEYKKELTELNSKKEKELIPKLREAMKDFKMYAIKMLKKSMIKREE